jgi:small subunit ribosomal protein S6e
MAEFKLVIGDPKTGKCHQSVVSADNANFFIGKKLGEKIHGEAFDMPGYEFEITGGADYCGFPLRKDIEGPIRKRIFITNGVGIRNRSDGVKLKKTVCGNTIHEKVTQISLKVLKHGKKALGPEEAPKEEAKKE